jgi:hypothetical protein
MTALHHDDEHPSLRIIQPGLQHFIHVRRTDSRATSLSTFFISWASSTTIMSAPKPVRLENDMARRSPPAKLLNSSIWSRSSRHCTPQRAWYHSLDTNLRQASLCSLESFSTMHAVSRR